MKKNQSLISIIIPTYNRAHLISKTLDSVLAQTHQNWECIVVDDGSSDHTDDVVGAYVNKDCRIKYHHRPKEHLAGGNGARNYGFIISRGEYIQWLDSDDLIKASKLEKQYNKLLKEPEVNVCLCKAQLFNNKSDIIVKESVEFINLSFFKDYITRRLDMGTIQPLWRKNFLRNKELYDENLKRGQDFDFFSRVSSTSDFNFNYVDEFLVLIRLDDDKRITSNKYNSVSQKNLLKAFLKVNELLIQKNIECRTYEKFLNILITKLISCVKNNDYNTAIEITQKVINSLIKKKHRLHFYKILFLTKLLKSTNNKGFYRLKYFYFLS